MAKWLKSTKEITVEFFSDMEMTLAEIFNIEAARAGLRGQPGVDMLGDGSADEVAGTAVTPIARK